LIGFLKPLGPDDAFLSHLGTKKPGETKKHPENWEETERTRKNRHPKSGLRS